MRLKRIKVLKGFYYMEDVLEEEVNAFISGLSIHEKAKVDFKVSGKYVFAFVKVYEEGY